MDQAPLESSSPSCVQFLIQPQSATSSGFQQRLHHVSLSYLTENYPALEELRGEVIKDVVIGPGFFAFLLGDGRVCRISYNLSAPPDESQWTVKSDKPSGARSSHPGGAEQGGAKVARSPAASGSEYADAAARLRARAASLSSDRRIDSRRLHILQQLAVRDTSSDQSGGPDHIGALFRRVVNNYRRNQPAARGAANPNNAQQNLEVPEDLIYQARQVLQNKSRQTIIRELQKTNLDLNLALNNLLSRDADDPDEEEPAEGEESLMVMDSASGQSYQISNEEIPALIQDLSSHSLPPGLEVAGDGELVLTEPPSATVAAGSIEESSRQGFGQSLTNISLNLHRHRGQPLPAESSNPFEVVLDSPKSKNTSKSGKRTASEPSENVAVTVPLTLGPKLAWWTDMDNCSALRHFTHIASLLNELLAVDTDGRLCQWCWGRAIPHLNMPGPDIERRHPRSAEFKLDGERIVMLKACWTRCTFITESNKITTFLDESIANVAGQVEHIASSFPEIANSGGAASLEVSELMSVVRTREDRLFWWGLMHSYDQFTVLEKKRELLKRMQSKDGSAKKIVIGSKVTRRSSPLYNPGAKAICLNNGKPYVCVLMETAWKLTEECRFSVLQPPHESPTSKPASSFGQKRSHTESEVGQVASSGNTTVRLTDSSAAAKKQPILTASSHPVKKQIEQADPTVVLRLSNVVFVDDAQGLAPTGKVVQVDGGFAAVVFDSSAPKESLPSSIPPMVAYSKQKLMRVEALQMATEAPAGSSCASLVQASPKEVRIPFDATILSYCVSKSGLDVLLRRPHGCSVFCPSLATGKVRTSRRMCPSLSSSLTTPVQRIDLSSVTPCEFLADAKMTSVPAPPQPQSVELSSFSVLNEVSLILDQNRALLPWKYDAGKTTIWESDLSNLPPVQCMAGAVISPQKQYDSALLVSAIVFQENPLLRRVLKCDAKALKAYLDRVYGNKSELLAQFLLHLGEVCDGNRNLFHVLADLCQPQSERIQARQMRLRREQTIRLRAAALAAQAKSKPLRTTPLASAGGQSPHAQSKTAASSMAAPTLASSFPSSGSLSLNPGSSRELPSQRVHLPFGLSASSSSPATAASASSASSTLAGFPGLPSQQQAGASSSTLLGATQPLSHPPLAGAASSASSASASGGGIFARSSVAAGGNLPRAASFSDAPANLTLASSVGSAFGGIFSSMTEENLLASGGSFPPMASGELPLGSFPLQSLQRAERDEDDDAQSHFSINTTAGTGGHSPASSLALSELSSTAATAASAPGVGSSMDDAPPQVPPLADQVTVSAPGTPSLVNVAAVQLPQQPVQQQPHAQQLPPMQQQQQQDEMVQFQGLGVDNFWPQQQQVGSLNPAPSSAMGPGEDNTGVHQLAEVAVRSMLDSGQLFNAGTAPNDPTRLTPSCSVATSASQTSTPQPALAKSSVAMEAVVPVPETMSPYLARSCEDLAGDAFECLIVLCAHDLLKPYLLTLLSHKNAAGFTPFQAAVTNRAYRAASQICMRALLISAKNESEFVSMCDKERAATQASEKSSDHDADTRKHSEAGQEGLTSQLSSNLGAQSRRLTGLGRGKLGAVHFQEEDMPEDGEDDNEDEDEDEDGDEEGHVIVDDDDEDDGDAEEDMASMGAASAESPPGSGALSPVLPESGDSDLLPSSASSDVSGGDGNMRLSPNFVAGAVAAAVAATNAGAVSAASGGESAAPAAADLFRIDTDAANKDLLAISERLSNAAGAADVEQPAGPPLDAAAAAPPPAVEEESAAGAIGSSQLALGGPQQQQYGENREVERSSSLSAMDVAANEVAPNVVHPVHSISIRETLAGVGEKKAGETQEAGPGMECAYERHNQELLNRMLCPSDSPAKDNPLFILAHNGQCSYVWSKANHISQKIYNCYTCGLTDQTCCCTTCANVCHGNHVHAFKHMSSAYCDCSLEANAGQCRALVAGDQQARIDLFHKLLRYTQLGKRSDAQGQPLLLLLARLVSQQVTEQKNRSGTSTRNSAFASSLIDRKLNLAEVNKFIDASNFCEVAMCICLDNWTAASAILLSGTTQARLLLGEVAQSDVVRMLSDSETEALVASQDGSQHLDCFVHALTLGSTFENTHNLNLLVKTILQARQCEQTKELAEKAARRLVRSFTRVLVSEQTECSLRRLKSTKCIDSSKLRALREFGIMAVEEMLDTAMTLIRPVMLGHVTDAAPLNMTSTSAAAVADPNYPSLAAGAAASARNVDQSTVHTLLSMPPLLQRRDGVAQAPSSSGGGSFPELPRAGARMSDSEESDGDDDDAGHGEQAMVVDEPAPAASASAAAAAASAGQSAPAAGADVAESSLAQVADDGAGSPSGSEAEASSPAEDFPGASSPHHEHMASEDAFTESDLEPESEDSFFDSSDDDGNFDHLVLRQLRQVAAGAPGSSTVERARQQAAVAAAASSGRSAAAGSSASSISAAAVAAAGTRLSAVAAAAAAAASSAPGSGAAPGGGGGVVTRSSQAFSSPSLDWVIDQSSLELPAAPALSASRVRRQRRRHSSWFGSSSTAAAGDGGDGNPEPAAASAPGPSMEAILTASSRQGAASVLCRSFGCCIKIIFQMVSVTMRAGQCTTEVLEPCIPGMPEEKLVTRNLIKMKLQPVWDWLMMRLDKVESDLRRGAVIASCKPIPADPSTSASLSSKPATTPSSGDIFMLKFLMDTMRSAAGENGDNLPSIQVHSLPHLLHLLEAMLHIVSLSATSPAGTTHCQSCVEYATPESAEAATTTAATTSTGCGSTASDTPRCSMDQLASATSVTSASGRVPIATDPSHHSSFFTRSPCLGMVGALSPSSRSRCKDSILLAGNPYLLEASKRQELLVGPPNQCLADWVQPRSSQCSSLGMFAPPRDLSHSSRVTEYPAPSTADRATADLEGTRLEERCHDLALENYERMSITTAAVAGRWRFFLEKLWPVFSKDMKDSELSHVMDRTLPFHVRESKFRRELEQTLDLRMRNPAEVHLKVTRGPQALADCFVGLNAHGSASDLPPCAFLGFLKVDFKDEPAEGSGVIRNLFTVVAEILESNHTLPKYTTSSPAIFTSTRVRVPASAYNRLSKPESTLTAEEKGVARDELWWSDIQKSPSRSIGANLSGHTMQMRKACLGDRLAARLLDHRDAAKVVASMVDHAPAWLLLQFLEDNALLHKHYRHVCLTLQNHSVLRNEWVDLEEAEDSNPVYFQGKVAVFESEQESLFYPGKETGFFSLRPGPATALRDNAYVNVGRMIGLALLHGCIFPLRLGRHVFKYLLRRPVCWHDLAFIDPTLYEGLRSLLDTARSENAKEQFVGISLTFRTPISHDLGGDAVDLFENGDGIAVTPENVDVYVERVATWHMLESASRGLQCMRLGLENVIDPERLSNLSPEDLRLLLNGSHTVDVALLERLTDYECGEKTSIERTYEIRKWFWSILRSMTSAQLAELMYFWTSSPAMPTAMDGKVASIVFRPPDHNRLPTANTCISRLYIPLYRSKQVLRARLLMAIKTREFGFV